MSYKTMYIRLPTLYKDCCSACTRHWNHRGGSERKASEAVPPPSKSF